MLTEQVISQYELFEALSQGGTVLTGNNRLAAVLIDKFDHYSLANNKAAWSSPDIMPMNSWLIKNWEQAILSGIIASNQLLLSNEQENQVWLDIVQESDYGNGLLRSSATAKFVCESWRLLQTWKITRSSVDYEHQIDSKAFHYWATQFEQRCQDENWIVTAQLAACDFYSKIVKNTHIILVGFEHLTPQLHSLFNRLAENLNTIKWFRFNTNNDFISRLDCTDVRDEIETFSHWAKQRLVDDPSARIALVVPDMHAMRPILLDTLERVLLPENLSPVHTNPDLEEPNKKQELLYLPWDISLGLPLNEYSIIKLAFKLLSLVRGKMTIETLSSLLRSPFIVGANAEQNTRALLDRQIRELGEPLVSLKTVSYYSGREGKTYSSPILNKLVKQLMIQKKTCLKLANSQQWALWFSQWLITAGWAAGRSLSSQEYQTIESWKKLLQSFTSLNLVISAMSFEKAVSILSQLASDKIFQIQSKSAPIQLLGLYESIGLDFDYLWVMNLHDEVWPVIPRPNPFIPLFIQHKHEMPHASWERELQLAKKITTRLAGSAKYVVFSYPLKSGTQDLRVSPLLVDYPLATKQDLSFDASVSWQQLIYQQTEMEEIKADSIATVAAERISGGSTIFKNQSLCPFRAFIENRLHAKPMRKTQVGLDAMKRGSLLHSVLEVFWKEINTHQQLLIKSQEQLINIITRCISIAITEMAERSPDSFSACFTEIEKQRLLALVLNWLELEKQRIAFKVIATEREININISGITTKLYIDRIDELENGDVVLIDYKTGQVSPTDWFGERPNDPQLPLYSVATNEKLSAVLFAQIKAGNVKFNGVVALADMIPNLPPTRRGVLKDATEHWPEILQNWDSVLMTLATNFVSSHIEVDPKEGLTTCRKLYCELAPVCRIDELLVTNDGFNNTGKKDK